MADSNVEIGNAGQHEKAHVDLRDNDVQKAFDLLELHGAQGLKDAGNGLAPYREVPFQAVEAPSHIITCSERVSPIEIVGCVSKANACISKIDDGPIHTVTCSDKALPPLVLGCVGERPAHPLGCSEKLPTESGCVSWHPPVEKVKPDIIATDTSPLTAEEKVDLNKHAAEIVKIVEQTHGFGHRDSGETQTVESYFDAAARRGGNLATNYLLDRINDLLKESGYPARVVPEGNNITVTDPATGRTLDHIAARKDDHESNVEKWMEKVLKLPNGRDCIIIH